MTKLVLPRLPRKNTTVNRTIRFESDIFDSLTELSESTGMTFNRLVNVCLRYAIDNTEQEETGVSKK